MHRRRIRFSSVYLTIAASLVSLPALHAQQWIAPSPEELHMTSVPDVSGAAAVVLNQDELTDDDNHMRSRYFRIKILTEAGKGLGDVQIQFDHRTDGNGYSVSEIAGRTIQPDGAIVPFSGKPYDKVLYRNKTDRYTAKVFSLPAVQVGSIIEYRYKLRWEDNLFWSPDWDIQTDLYLVKGHFLWRPTDKQLTTTSRGHESTTSALAWDTALPKGVELKKTRLPTNRLLLEVNVDHVPPFNSEEYMPPIQSSAYHVHFYYTPYRNAQEYWRTEGKYWSSESNKFANVNDLVRDTAREYVGGASTDEARAKAIYRGVSRFENTDFTRARDSAEDKAEGLRLTKSAEDVIRRKRGSSDQIAMTYVALARAAGLNASMMIVTDRSERILVPTWLNFNQLTDVVAIVNYDGKDHFLDPGSPFTPYDHLHWAHSLAVGVRQSAKDTEMMPLPADGYKFSHTSRVADLRLEDGGSMSGTVNISYEGCPAMVWRRTALRTDEAELREKLKQSLEELLPGGTEVDVKSITGTTDPDVPLKVSYSVKGSMGTSAGSRVVLPGDIFVAGSRPQFPHEHRDQAVYYHYPEFQQDAVRISFPAGYSIESAPAEAKVGYKQSAQYGQRSKASANAVTVWRDLAIGDFYFPLEEFSDLRKFYAGFEQKDHDSIILKRSGSNEKASVQ